MQKPDQLRATEFTDTPGVSETDPRVSADGQQVVFLRTVYKGSVGLDNDKTGFYTAERGDKNERLVVRQLEPPYRYQAMTWSPDGRLVAVRCQPKTSNPCEIVRLNADGTGTTSINAPAGPRGGISPDLSVTPDATEVVYSTESQIVVAKLDGSGSRSLGEGAWPDISPDGSTIAFTSLDGDDPGCQIRREIWTMSAADGSNRQNVSQLPCSNSATSGNVGQNTIENYPEWSPDGQWIAYRPPGSGIGLIRADGSERRNLFQPGAQGDTVSWSKPPGGVGPPPR